MEKGRGGERRFVSHLEEGMIIDIAKKNSPRAVKCYLRKKD